MENWIISAFADEHSDALTDQIAALQRFGIGHIELRFLDGRNVAELSEQEARQARQLLDAGGIRVSAVGSPLGKISLTDGHAAHLEKARRVFATANLLGTELIRMFSYYLPEGSTRDQCRGQVLDRLGAMLELADRFGVKLCHENEAGIYGESPAHCLDLLQSFGGRLGCVFDMGNFLLEGYSPYPQAYQLLEPYITYFHIKDALSAGAIVPAGRGEAGIRQILHDHRARHGRVLLSIEPHLQTFSGLNQLVNKKNFDNPYKFETQQAAFAEAVRCVRALL